jgi:hypothetical protein
MVVLESNTRWPAWLEEPTSALVAQRPGESPSAFESRAARFISQGPAPITATVVTSPALTPDHLSLRRVVVKSLLGMMQAAGRGHVVLVADGDHAACRAVARLLQSLHREIGADSNVSLRLRTLPRAAEAAVRAA